ncbi:hypothetical protein HQ489_04165 [Candidatus Woesearchaeota archaeon]|nr:hypothetical protein [Candidatus Woesearchaeota archaeon]
MKKILLITVALLLMVFLVGCLDYKAYEAPAGDDTDAALLSEIEQLEKELAAGPTTVEEDVVLPELKEDTGTPKTTSETTSELKVITIKENEVLKLNVKTNDPDQDPVTLTFSKPLDQIGQWKTNYGDAGEYQVTIAATDGKLTTEQKVKIVVERVNVPPVIGTVVDITVREGQIVNFEPVVTDPNGDAINVDVSEPLKSGTFATDHTSAGEYKIKVTASDGELGAEKIFKLTVTDVNEKPIIAGVQDLTVKEGTKVEIKPIVTDLDNDNLIIKISDPVGDDGVWLTEFTDHGEYQITITVDDGKDVVTKKIKLVVEDVNMPPQIVEIGLASN